MKVRQDAKVNIDVNVELPAIQSEFRRFKREVAKLDEDLKEEIDDIEEDLLAVMPNSEPYRINRAINKLSGFMQELDDEDSRLSKIVKGTKRGMELGQKLGKTYNKLAQWLALPVVPDVFLGK